jgi:hypothetical protein
LSLQLANPVAELASRGSSAASAALAADPRRYARSGRSSIPLGEAGFFIYRMPPGLPRGERGVVGVRVAGFVLRVWARKCRSNFRSDQQLVHCPIADYPPTT